VLLHDFEGWRHREIAEHLGIPSGTVRSHLHFARKSLRRDADLAQLVTEHGPNGQVHTEEVPRVGPGRDLESVPVGSDSPDMKSEESETYQRASSIGRTA
jgi:hypothetical protein